MGELVLVCKKYVKSNSFMLLETTCLNNMNKDQKKLDPRFKRDVIISRRCHKIPYEVQTGRIKKYVGISK